MRRTTALYTWTCPQSVAASQHHIKRSAEDRDGPSRVDNVTRHVCIAANVPLQERGHSGNGHTYLPFKCSTGHSFNRAVSVSARQLCRFPCRQGQPCVVMAQDAKKGYYYGTDSAGQPTHM